MAKRRVKRRLKLGNIFLVFSLFVLIGLVFIYFNKSIDLKNVKDVKVKIPKINKVIEPSEKVTTASVIAVGDNLIHSSVYKDANRLANYNGYDFKPMYELIKPIVSKYDLAYYNQESILGGTDLGLNDYPTFNSPQDILNEFDKPVEPHVKNLNNKNILDTNKESSKSNILKNTELS